MTQFYTYLYKDPKSGVIRYVGKGGARRPLDHLGSRCDTQLGRMLKKRVREGFAVEPILIPAKSDDDAREMEMLLIAIIGREDLGQGTLFNKTDGGEGSAGRIVKNEEKQKRALTFKNKSKEEQADITARIQSTRRQTVSDPAFQERFSRIMSEGKSRKCTVDGVTIFNSRKELIDTLGQSKVSGSRSPNFRYV